MCGVARRGKDDAFFTTGPLLLQGGSGDDIKVVFANMTTRQSCMHMFLMMVVQQGHCDTKTAAAEAAVTQTR